MANSKKRCKHCTEYFEVSGMVSAPAGVFCCVEHMLAWVDDKRDKDKEKGRQWQRELKEKTNTPKKAREYVETRAACLDKLQDLVNQYVKYVKDLGDSCCTCKTTNPGIKYDAGHCFTRGARPELRFELTNIHIQCSNYCNQNNSGRQAEHKVFIAEKYGAEHLARLEDRTKWPSLKDTFPDNEAIRKEITRYRALLRSHDLRPIR